MAVEPEKGERNACMTLRCPSCGRTSGVGTESAVARCAACGTAAPEPTTGELELPQNRHKKETDELYPV